MSRTLPAAREAFVAALTQDTPGPDLARLVAVLDALIAWSVARPGRLAFRAAAAGKSAVSFSRVGAKGAFWSAQVTRGVGPRLEIHLPSADALDDARQASVMQTLNAHSRAVLMEGDRLRIGFGALKNAAAQAAVLALMDQLVADRDAPAESSPAESSPAEPSRPA
jgi:hypothetical protein